MKFKKTIISTLILTTLSVVASTDYLAIIKKEKNNFDVVENPLWKNIPPTYTEWLDTGSFNNCNSWLPSISQQEVNFIQTANCDVEQERTKSNRQQNTIDSTIKTINQETENQFINKSINRNINVSNALPLEEKGNYNCELWTPEPSTVYSGTIFEQERYCDVDMMQKWSYYSDLSLVGTWEDRYTEGTGYETQDVLGTKSWENASSTYTIWSDTGIIANCNTWLPAILNQKSDFNQSTNCDHEQERTRTDREQNPITGEFNVINTAVENQNDSRLNNRDVVVDSDLPIVEQTNYNCEVWTPEASTIYSGTIFEQERYCDVDMMQKWNYNSESLPIGNWEERYTEKTGYETQDIVGTKAWESASSTYTAWDDTGVLSNCGLFLPSISQQKSDLTQSRNCDYAQERTRTDREQNPITGQINIVNTVVETQNEFKVNNRIINVRNDSPLVEQNNYNCEAWTPSTSSVYIGTAMNQQRDCDKDMMQNWIYSLDGSDIHNWEERYTEKTGSETQNTIGTMRLNNCSQILNQGHSTGNGIYPVTTPLGNIDVLCEMTIDGGGWTLVTYAGDTINNNKTETSGSGVDKTWNPLMFNWGAIQTDSPTTSVSFSRFDYFKNNVKASDEFMAKRTSVSNKMVIFPIVNTEWFGRDQSEGHFSITSGNSVLPYLKLTKTGDTGWKTETENIVWSYVGSTSAGHPGINWNIPESENCDSCGNSYETGLNHRSILYWESYTEDEAHEGFKPYWFHGTPIIIFSKLTYFL